MSKEEWIYYHALYHLLTHWTAYMATLVLLITIGIILSTSSVVTCRKYINVAIILVGVASVFFLMRMDKFGRIVNQKIGDEAAQATMWIPHPWNLVIGRTATVAIALFDLLIV